MGIFNPLERPERQHAIDLARVVSIEQEIGKKQSLPRDGVSFEALVTTDEVVQALLRKLEIAKVVAIGSGELLAKAKADADLAAKKARNADMSRKAKQAEKRVRALSDRIDAVRADLAWLVEHVEELDTYNRFERGDLPFVPDAEVRVRQRPAHVVPAEYRDEVRWEDASGNRASYFKRDAEGELVPVHDEYTRRVVRVCQREEQPAPAWMPDRFAEAIRLVDAAGEQIWPLC